MFKKNKNGKKTLLSLNSENPAVNFFVGAVLLSALVYILIGLIFRKGDLTTIFFTGCGDFFMDFFNSVRDAAQGVAVYTERHVIYPPLANLIFLAISFFTPDAYNNTDFSQRYSWTEYPAAIAVAVIWCVICLATFVVIFTFAQKKLSVAKRVLVSLLMFFSVPILYLLERGNIIILTLFALALYAFTYNSKSKIKRELGLIALAFAFAIKLYPVVFGWFLIADKRFKEAIRCAIYGVALLVIPSFFFGGFSCFHQIFLNIFSFSSGTGNVLSIMLEYIGMPPLGQSIMTALVYAWVFICGICFAISPFIRKDQPYKTWSLGLVTILCVPSLTSIYSWAFMLIPLIMLFCRSELTKKDMTYSVMMTVPFVFLPFRFSHHVSGNTVLVYVATAVFSVWCVVDMIKDTVNYIKARKA